MQGSEREFAQTGAFGERPIFKVGRVADVEALEEVGAVEAQGICQDNGGRFGVECSSGLYILLEFG